MLFLDKIFISEVSMKHYRVGELDILVEPGPITLREDLLSEPFLCEEECSSQPFRIQVEEADLSFLREAPVDLYTGSYELRQWQDRSFLLCHWETHRFAFGLYLDELYGDGVLHYLCSKELAGTVELTAAHLLGLAGLHHRLLRRGAMVLHASLIHWQGQAIAFAAPSQVGKSTQARLWQDYAGAETLNGDRALLFYKDGQWYAGGYIACGSSQICKNRILPLRGIVLLEQWQENHAQIAKGKERIHALFTGAEIFHWSMEDMDLALDLAKRIAEQVPMIHLRCRPDRAAVETLQHFLEEQ